MPKVWTEEQLRAALEECQGAYEASARQYVYALRERNRIAAKTVDEVARHLGIDLPDREKE